MSKIIKTAIAALALAATPATPVLAQGKGETIKFQDYPGTGNMLIRVAISKGYCEKYGIKCELQVIPSGPLAAQALLAKSIDAAFIQPEVTAHAILKGAKMKAVVGGAVTNTNILIAGNHLETPNAGKPWPAFMNDFKGKKIGVTARGSAVETAMTFLLLKAGLKPDDVTFVAVGGPVAAYGALTSKQVDGVMMFEPSGALCDVLQTCKVIWRGSDDKEPAELYATNGGNAGLVFRQDTIDGTPHVIDAVIKAVQDADAFINTAANFEEVITISGTYFKFDMPKGDEVVRTIMKRAVKDKSYTAPISRAAIKASIDYMVANKIIETPVAVSDLIYDKAP